ncbi:gastric triacylglycerol lipase-like isoform X1 [Haemaphysalis longicornis]
MFWGASLLTLASLQSVGGSDVAEDARLCPADLMRRFGHDVEVHRVTTEDGYILEVDRMPARRKDGTEVAHTPVLLVHGVFLNAASWVVNQPSQSPGFILSDAGFDVWFVNTRGAPESNYHESLGMEDPLFWAWSFDEIGRYDLAAVIDHILKESGFAKVGLLTFSQGFTASLVFLSMRPDYNDKVNIIVGYGPVANLTHLKSPVRFLVPLAESLMAVNDFFTNGGLLLSSLGQKDVIATACDSPLRDICYKPLATVFGMSSSQHNRTRIPVYVANIPVGTSSQNALHYTQLCRKQDFVRFDHGKEENLARYSQATPPAYPLERIRVPVALFRGLGDICADPEDIEDLSRKLSDVLVADYVVSDPEFGHLDFVFGINATDILHRHMVDVLSRYTSVSSYG